jgi:RpiR family carbohydrate utilization transcriptional regulator
MILEMISMDSYEKIPGMIMKIQALKGGMSKAEQQVCDYIVAHPEEVIYLSVSELASASGVSDATVIRASQKIGSSSYQELKISLAQDIVTPLQAVNEEISEADPPKTVLEKVFQSALHTLNFTYNMLKADEIVLAAEKLMGARRIAICGLGNSSAIAADTQHKLMRLGLSASAYSDSHLQIIGASSMSKGDVLFAISHSGSSKDIVRVAEIAKENGAYVISLTSLGINPLSDIADLALYTASNETHYRAVALSSRIAQMAIVDAIYTFIALKKPDAVEGFYKLEKNLGDTKY